jgi:hypothetical protein
MQSTKIITLGMRTNITDDASAELSRLLGAAGMARLTGEDMPAWGETHRAEFAGLLGRVTAAQRTTALRSLKRHGIATAGL